MEMHDPPHPGEFIRTVYLAPLGVSVRSAAARLDVAPSTLSRLLNGDAGISAEMALRLSKTLGRFPESWLTMQNRYDLWQARRRIRLEAVRKLEIQSP